MTFRELKNQAAKLLRAAGIEEASGDAELILFHVTGFDRNRYILTGESEAGEETCACVLKLAEQRAQHVPLQYLLGSAPFYGRDFLVTPDVLIPRFDTEILAERAIRFLKAGERVLDLCTGSGCIAVTLKKACEEAEVSASDISEAALRVAAENAGRHGADIHFYRSDLLCDVPGRYSLIVSNPPYIRQSVIAELQEEVRLHEPLLALSGGEDGLEVYRRLIRQAPCRLEPGGRLLLEIGFDQGETVSKLLENEGFSDVLVSRDLGGRDRVAEGLWNRID